MMAPRTRLEGGYTLMEVLLAAALLVLGLLTLGSIGNSTRDFVAESRAEARATSELRRNLEAISNVLRGADIDTLDGLDASWESENPSFARVVGADLDDRLRGETEELRWAAADRAVDGVAEPGGVYLVASGAQRLVADRVPRGGFRIRQNGNTLIVSLTTYYVTSDRATALVSGRTAISMRN